jgi:hypothetical protein
MFDFSIWNLIAGLGGGGLITLLLVSIFAPGLVSVAAEGFKPLAKALGEGIVYTAKGAWIAIKDILDNVYTILFVVALCAAALLYGNATSKPDCEQCIKELRKEYRFVPKTAAEKKAAERPLWKFW